MVFKIHAQSLEHFTILKITANFLQFDEVNVILNVEWDPSSPAPQILHRIHVI